MRRLIHIFNRLILYFILTLLLLSDTNAQEKLKPGNFYIGCIVKPGQDTTWGKIKYKSMIHNHYKVVFKEAYDQEEETFEPSELDAYQISGLKYLSVPFSGRDSFKRHTFMLVIIDGQISLYKWYYNEKQQYFEDNDFWDYTTEIDQDKQGVRIQYYLQRDGQNHVDVSSGKFAWKFNKTMANFLSDCPELAEKVKKKKEGYKKEDLEKIILEYNANCQLPTSYVQ